MANSAKPRFYNDQDKIRWNITNVCIQMLFGVRFGEASRIQKIKRWKRVVEMFTRRSCRAERAAGGNNVINNKMSHIILE